MVCLKSFIHAIRLLIVWCPLLVQRLNYPHAVALYHFIRAGLRGKAAVTDAPTRLSQRRRHEPVVTQCNANNSCICSWIHNSGVTIKFSPTSAGMWHAVRDRGLKKEVLMAHTTCSAIKTLVGEKWGQDTSHMASVQRRRNKHPNTGLVHIF